MLLVREYLRAQHSPSSPNSTACAVRERGPLCVVLDAVARALDRPTLSPRPPRSPPFPQFLASMAWRTPPRTVVAATRGEAGCESGGMAERIRYMLKAAARAPPKHTTPTT